MWALALLAPFRLVAGEGGALGAAAWALGPLAVSADEVVDPGRAATGHRALAARVGGLRSEGEPALVDGPQTGGNLVRVAPGLDPLLAGRAPGPAGGFLFVAVGERRCPGALGRQPFVICRFGPR